MNKAFENSKIHWLITFNNQAVVHKQGIYIKTTRSIEKKDSHEIGQSIVTNSANLNGWEYIS